MNLKEFKRIAKQTDKVGTSFKANNLCGRGTYHLRLNLERH